jgi:hypothetical protein
LKWFLKVFESTREENYKMPIHTCTATPDIFDAVWTYIPNEVIDFSKFTTVRSLVIECFRPDQSTPPTARTPWCLLGSNVQEQYIVCSGEVFDINSLFAPRTPRTPCTPKMNLYSPRGGGGGGDEPHQPIDHSEPYPFPSLHMFPLLEKLIIQNTFHSSITSSPVYLKSFTDMPPNLHTLEFHNTLVEDIGSVIQQCHHLTSLRLHNNVHPITLTYLPHTLNAFYVSGETFTNDIQIPLNTAVIRFIHSTLNYIHMDPAVEQLTKAGGRHERFIIAGCQSPYDARILADNKIRFLPKVQHILNTNAHHIYQHFGAIPKQIRMPADEELADNYIITALHLASNYPRRMAEFIALA